MDKIRMILLCFFIASFSTLYAQCEDDMFEKAYPLLKNSYFLKSFDIRLKKGKPNQPLPIFKRTMYLNQANLYRFVIINSNKYKGELILDLYSTKQKVASTYNPRTKQTVTTFEFMCQMTGVYTLVFYYKGGVKSCSVVLIGLDNNFKALEYYK